MERVEMYMLEEVNQTPTIEDIQECVRIANDKDCIVQLVWLMRYSGEYVRNIFPGEDPEDFFKNHIPHRYAV